jgi:hypothetical protein
VQLSHLALAILSRIIWDATHVAYFGKPCVPAMFVPLGFLGKPTVYIKSIFSYLVTPSYQSISRISISSHSGKAVCRIMYVPLYLQNLRQQRAGSSIASRLIFHRRIKPIHPRLPHFAGMTSGEMYHMLGGTPYQTHTSTR